MFRLQMLFMLSLLGTEAAAGLIPYVRMDAAFLKDDGGMHQHYQVPCSARFVPECILVRLAVMMVMNISESTRRAAGVQLVKSPWLF